ncbi:Alpha crystallin/Hsp20 domain-containing protein [Cinnamomum micranthum f. kanehirae]|uniref:Alpha crystallin/Hsp20 domain-containing protein n=1 Tax=Cinnamomum micranthum f. kanehirae TaxID=337451 RepID=A0A443Q2U9_9MAGN|nr:Alpha crystallin/Hsp20 domain-containing protein [Cinnamomum micranthum f. kanehirae]
MEKKRDTGRKLEKRREREDLLSTQRNTTDHEEEAITSYKTPANSSRDINGFDVCLLHLLLGHCHSEHPILHSSFHLIYSGVLWQPESPKELTAAPLNAVPLVVLLFLLSAPLSAYLQDPSFFQLHLHLFLLQTWKVRFEDMSFWGFLPVYTGVGQCRCLTSQVGACESTWEVLERVPNVKREGIEDVGSSAEEAGNERHLESIDCRKENGTD